MGHNKNKCPFNAAAPALSSSVDIVNNSSESRNVRQRREAVGGAGPEFDGNSDDEDISNGVEEGISDSGSDEDDSSSPLSSAALPVSTSAPARVSPWIAQQVHFTQNVPPESWLSGTHPFDSSDCGPKIPEGTGTTPLDIFRLFISDAIVSGFVLETNRYALKKDGSQWVMMSDWELMRFFSIILFMGIQNMPERELYWQDSEFQAEFVRSKMTMQRFASILSNWHWQDSSSLSPQEVRDRNRDDCFWSVASFVEELAVVSRKLYKPHRHLDVDEQCIPFKGRHIAKQYNKDKPNKWHFKVYALNCAHSGYMSNFYLYRGKNEHRPAEHAHVQTSNYPVYKLTLPAMYQQQWYILYTDNYFTSVPSMSTMLEREIYQVGTVRSNKLADAKALVIPKKAKPQRGFYKCFKNATNGIYLVSWMDRKPVNILSAIETKTTTCVRRSHTGAANTIPCPSVVALYNKAMGGTDSFDQRLSYYWPHIRTVKWTVRVLIHFFYVAVLNAHILFKEHNSLIRGHQNYTFLSFCKTLMRQCASYGPQIVPTPRMLPFRPHRLTSELERSTGIHTPVHVRCLPAEESHSGAANYCRRICAVCKKTSSFMCKQCQVGLHIRMDGIDNCWEQHHGPVFS